jgi:hypothetical protein
MNKFTIISIGNMDSTNFDSLDHERGCLLKNRKVEEIFILDSPG